MSEKETVTFGGKEYVVEDLSEEGRRLVTSLKFVDQELATTEARVAVLTTAKAAYLASLKQELPD